MRRGTIILLIFVLVAVGIVGATQFLQRRPPLQITVAVSPLAESWVRAAAETYNASSRIVNANRRVAVRVETVDDIDVWDGNTPGWQEGTLETNSRPTVWIPATSLSAGYVAVERRLPFVEVAPSAARTLLVWGAFTSEIDRLTDVTRFGLGWEAVQRTTLGAELSGDYLDLAFTRPDDTMAGLAVLLSAAADFHEKPMLTGADLAASDFREWVLPVIQSVPNFDTLGGDPARTIAQRGASVADVALVPESQWLSTLSGLPAADAFQLAYPEYPFVFDFPVLRWNSENVSADEQAAAADFGNFLLSNAQQQAAAAYGLRPAVGEAAFQEAQPYGVIPAADLTNAITGPDRSAILALMTWYTQNN